MFEDEGRIKAVPTAKRSNRLYLHTRIPIERIKRCCVHVVIGSSHVVVPRTHSLALIQLDYSVK